MQIRLIHKNARCAWLEIDDGGVYYAKKEYEVVVNGEVWCVTGKVVAALFGLKPDTDYSVAVESCCLEFRTDYEFVTLNVKDFGAKGDGVHDDTVFVQAAVAACPKNSRVLIPSGEYRVTSVFLKSGCSIELLKGARLVGDDARSNYSVLPGMVESYDEFGEYNLGTWEGNPLSMYAGIFTGIDVSDVEIYGEGVVDGNASENNWWYNAKIMRGAWRPRLLYLIRCSNIRIGGLLFCNSPSWNIHAYFSQNIEIIGTEIVNPVDSPNTDGIDIESTSDVKIYGVHFSLGDDCIALKSGKIYMAKKYSTPTVNVEIAQCFMENGHGAVTVGSEMAAGVKDIHVSKCLFVNTDRGLRIKTRRGRGELAVVDNIYFSDIVMRGVGTPFVINCFYFCDPDGKSKYVQTREALPVDSRTPSIKNLYFERITCYDTNVAAAYFFGLPEKKIENICMKDICIYFAENAKKGEPDMYSGVVELCKSGFFADNVAVLELDNVVIEGHYGDAYILKNIDTCLKKNRRLV